MNQIMGEWGGRGLKSNTWQVFYGGESYNLGQEHVEEVEGSFSNVHRIL